MPKNSENNGKKLKMTKIKDLRDDDGVRPEKKEVHPEIEDWSAVGFNQCHDAHSDLDVDHDFEYLSKVILKAKCEYPIFIKNHIQYSCLPKEHEFIASQIRVHADKVLVLRRC